MSKPRLSHFVVAAWATAFIGCNYTTYEDCPFYCWESEVPYSKIPQSGAHPGYYDQQCTHALSLDGLRVPIPELGLAARHCYLGSPASAAENTENYFLVKTAVQKLAASEPLSTDEADAYDLIAELLDRDAYENCVGQLTCYGNPGVGCDVDDNTNGDQSCTNASAASLCSSLVEGLLEDLLDRSSPQQYPQCSGTEYYEGAAPLCEGYVPDMNDTEGPCAGDGLLPVTAR